MMDMNDFYTGQSLNAYEYLGAHPLKNQVVFRTFAPNAEKVSLLLEGQEIPMVPIYDGNFYEVSVSDAGAGMWYEFRIYQKDGTFTDHADPYGFYMELRPAHRSIITDLHSYQFQDSEWMKQRSDVPDQPVNIYELHLGSWRQQKSGQWYSYEELADRLIPYVKENGYNYVEFMPISEHPSDQSWGYQNTGFYAPTSRYGSPDGLKRLIDRLHQNGVGVILDFVPVHFAIDTYGLARYDGTSLYEYPNPDVGNSEWGSYNFMHSRGEVRSFLQSAANFWLKEYHFDGLRMDAISRIIYWQGDEKRGQNGSAIDFLKVMNRDVKKENPGCILIAEDSTNYPGVTRPVNEGGLGFDYKWDMGWMHDTLEYFQTSPKDRSRNYHKLTFSMMYFYNDKYLMPYSHDEVVHGKATILQKMNGSYEQKFPQARAMYLYMMTHPGKKLNFMGNEIGQLREWDEKREQDWSLLHYPVHDSFHHYMKELNTLYLDHSALWEKDYLKDGFSWLDCHQEARCIYVLERKSKSERLIALFNFSDQTQKDYRLDLPDTEESTVLLDSDWKRFGGSTPDDQTDCVLKEEELICTLPPFSGILLKAVPAEKKKGSSKLEAEETDRKELPLKQDPVLLPSDKI